MKYLKVSVVRIQVSGRNVDKKINCYYHIGGEFRDHFGDG